MSQAEDRLEQLLTDLYLNAGIEPEHFPWVREHAFHPTRRWRFDFAWPASKLAVEVEGGIYVSGRHARGAGIEKDLEKYAEALLQGWHVLRVSPGQIASGRAVIWIDRALALLRASTNPSQLGGN